MEIILIIIYNTMLVKAFFLK